MSWTLWRHHTYTHRYKPFYSMKTTSLYPVLVIENDEYVTDVMRRTAEGSFPEAVLQFVVDDQAAQRSLLSTNPPMPKLIIHGTYLEQLLTESDTNHWLREHPVAIIIAQLVLSRLDWPTSAGITLTLGTPTYCPKPELIVEWACFWAQLRRCWSQQAATSRLYH
ncbi:hypothetical protein [Spirosoma rhododendri]|uniref:Response regulator n=1 Tax=Spirosoma rhododendri TaxID=2728024 RepID=A0A7L5DT74_9BACT|nr:hypothetical protein [Spirosoma rhododendri]QJD81664.1 hypothetical protein HH216_25320 [Spirosoma rhododendri]